MPDAADAALHRDPNEAEAPRPACQTRRSLLLAPGMAALASPALVRTALARPALARTGLHGAGAGEVLLRCGGTGMALATIHRLALAWAEAEPVASARIALLPSFGTKGGLNALAAGALDIALAARPLTRQERDQGLAAASYGVTPIAFATRAAPPGQGPEEVSLAEVEEILSGTRTAWPDRTPLRLVRREPSDANWLTLAALSPGMAAAVERARRRPGLLTAASDQENADALERLGGSFGTIPLGQLLAEERPLRPLRLDGISPSPATLAEGRYPLAQPQFIATTLAPPPAAQAFLRFLAGAEARGVLAGLGHAPPPAAPA